MTQTAHTLPITPAQVAPTPGPHAAARRPAAPIATRKSCNPDGIGLSHYVLMDRKVAK